MLSGLDLLGKDVCAFFFDFDTIPYYALMQKLQLCNHILTWHCSYLTDREQQVVVKVLLQSAIDCEEWLHFLLEMRRSPVEKSSVCSLDPTSSANSCMCGSVAGFLDSSDVIIATVSAIQLQSSILVL